MYLNNLILLDSRGVDKWACNVYNMLWTGNNNNFKWKRWLIILSSIFNIQTYKDDYDEHVIDH